MGEVNRCNFFSIDTEVYSNVMIEPCITGNHTIELEDISWIYRKPFGRAILYGVTRTGKLKERY